MTDTIDVAALVERLRNGCASTGDSDDGYFETFDIDDANQTMQDAATALQAQADALAEARRLVSESEAQRYRSCGELLTRATTAEADARAMREALEQIDQSWQAATSGNRTDVARITGWQGALDNMGQIFAWIARRALGGSNTPEAPVTPTLSDRTAILRRLADGDRIVYSRDGDDAWMSGGDRAFVERDAVLELRASGFIERAGTTGDPETDDEHDRISAAGRAALAREGK